MKEYERILWRDVEFNNIGNNIIWEGFLFCYFELLSKFLVNFLWFMIYFLFRV